MDTRKLSAFIETVRVGSINAAAEQLGYTQSGLSYILRSLEEELNVQLLERTPSGIALTENGKALFKDINAIVEKTDELNNKIIGLFSRQQHDKETIRLAAYPSTTVNWIAEEMASFMLKYPEFMIDMRVGVVAIPQWVENGMVDIGIVEQGLVSSLAVNHKWTYLRDEEFCAAFPQSCPLAEHDCVTLEMLEDYRVILPTLNEKNCVMEEIGKRKIQFKDHISIRLEDGSVMFSLIEKGFGVSFLSSQYKKECPPGVCMRPFSPPISRKLGVLTSKDVNKKGVILFEKWLLEHSRNCVYDFS